ncbi:MAG: SDR family NAD(P)-dependent oxidoreductase, partial [Acidobacteria bacterium]|nr:SDR family NAD(P)-dependent oxidoreductase [Acidobacteriota bacterium]
MRDKVAVITGGNTGIGRAVALGFAEEGADVAVAYIAREPEAQTLLSAIEAKGRHALAVRADVTVEADVRAMVAAVLERFGRIDILVNNAGIQKAQPLVEMSAEDFDRMIAVHMRGTFLCCRHVAPHMLERRAGRIINVTSQLAYIGRPRYTAYSAAKGG